MVLVRFETSDGRQICAHIELLERSGIIQDLYRVVGKPDREQTLLPLTGVSSEVLLKILLWAEYHKKDEEPEWVQSPIDEEVSELQIHDWDKEFLRDKYVTIFAIMMGADYLNIRWLMKLCAQKLADSCRGRTPLDIRYFLQMLPPCPMLELQSQQQQTQHLLGYGDRTDPEASSVPAGKGEIGSINGLAPDMRLM